MLTDDRWLSASGALKGPAVRQMMEMHVGRAATPARHILEILALGLGLEIFNRVQFI